MAYCWFAVTGERAPAAEASLVQWGKQELKGDASLQQVRGESERERELRVIRENRMNIY